MGRHRCPGFFTAKSGGHPNLGTSAQTNAVFDEVITSPKPVRDRMAIRESDRSFPPTAAPRGRRPWQISSNRDSAHRQSGETAGYASLARRPPKSGCILRFLGKASSVQHGALGKRRLGRSRRKKAYRPMHIRALADVIPDPWTRTKHLVLSRMPRPCAAFPTDKSRSCAIVRSFGSRVPSAHVARCDFTPSDFRLTLHVFGQRGWAASNIPN